MVFLDGISNYRIGKLLGKGGFARVYECESKNENGKLIAMKVIRKEEINTIQLRRRMINEIMVHNSISNANVVQLFTYFEDNDRVYLTMELCPGLLNCF